MALIDEGTVAVGRDAREVAAQCEQIGAGCKRKLLEDQIPAGTVATTPFYLDVREVTNGELAAFFNSLASSLYVEEDEDNHVPRFVRFNKGAGPFEAHLYDLWADLGGIDYTPAKAYATRAGRDSWPANDVTWFGASLYCSSIGKRLPTEDEWEAAARGHEDRLFPWGARPPSCGQVVVPNDGHIPMSGDCPKLDAPATVESAPLDVTPQGVHDLGGNVAEWVDAVYVPGNRLDESRCRRWRPAARDPRRLVLPLAPGANQRSQPAAAHVYRLRPGISLCVGHRSTITQRKEKGVVHWPLQRSGTR